MKAGVMIDDFVVRKHQEESQQDMYAMWCNYEDMVYSEFKGNFSDEGVTTLTQPTLKELGNKKNVLVYAMDEKKAKYLFVSLGEDENKEGFIFRFPEHKII